MVVALQRSLFLFHPVLQASCWNVMIFARRVENRLSLDGLAHRREKFVPALRPRIREQHPYAKREYHGNQHWEVSSTFLLETAS